MTVFVCIDDTMGMAFNGRRQSRDSAVVEDILRSCGGVPQMDARSEKLFGEGGGTPHPSASLTPSPQGEGLFGEGGEGTSSTASGPPSPYPLCGVATSPPDRGSRPQGVGLFGEGGEGCADAYFMEFCCREEVLQKAERIVLYRWNRTYPADAKFTMPKGFTLKESREFTGSSHEKITREEYTRAK